LPELWSKDGGRKGIIMKYYIIYEKINPMSARLISIVEHLEVTDDFCKKHARCYYEEVIIGN